MQTEAELSLLPLTAEILHNFFQHVTLCVVYRSLKLIILNEDDENISRVCYNQRSLIFLLEKGCEKQNQHKNVVTKP